MTRIKADWGGGLSAVLWNINRGYICLFRRASVLMMQGCVACCYVAFLTLCSYATLIA